MATGQPVTAPAPERAQQTRKRERLKGRTEQNKRREGGKGRLQVSDLQAGSAGSAETVMDGCTQKTAAWGGGEDPIGPARLKEVQIRRSSLPWPSSRLFYLS